MVVWIELAAKTLFIATSETILRVVVLIVVAMTLVVWIAFAAKTLLRAINVDALPVVTLVVEA